MEFLNDIQRKVQDFASGNASALLTAGGVVGTVATAVLAGRAGAKADRILREKETEKREALAIDGVVRDDVPKNLLTKMEKLVLVGPQFIPPVLVGGGTIASIVFANRISAQKAAALAAAYGLSQKQLEEYKEKVEEKLGGAKKDRPSGEELNAELAQERANRTPGAGQFIIVEGGDVLCFDESGGRYFKSSMEKLQRAANKVNEEIIHCAPVSLNEFYDQLDLPPTSWGDAVGFNQDNLLELDIKAILSPEDQKTPCLAIDFKRLPTPDYTKIHQ